MAYFGKICSINCKFYAIHYQNGLIYKEPDALSVTKKLFSLH